MSTGTSDRVWTGWEGLRVWREVVQLIQEESAVIDCAKTFGGYVLARRYLNTRKGLIPVPLRPSAA